jgi:hypothetical protein
VLRCCGPSRPPLTPALQRGRCRFTAHQPEKFFDTCGQHSDHQSIDSARERNRRPERSGAYSRRSYSSASDLRPSILRRTLPCIHRPREARTPHQGFDQCRELDGARCGCEGRCLRGTAGEERSGRKGGAGQYFTPRALIRGIVDGIRSQPGEVVCDPACGTGGFLLAAHEYLVNNNPHLDRYQKKHLKLQALRGVELVDAVTRLCAMNLMLRRAERGRSV